ncbi:MAG: putative FAD-linked oxidoreductase [Alphaproteobacteria bacterium MarineAlpha4_Bin2]|nr:MAG: putative FAD-linked oxidoreductase [Alphaproteobacteria bacterium MarineAlpha4_Bin2]
MTTLTPEILQLLKDAVGSGGFLDNPSDTESYTVDARELYHGKTQIVLRPATTEVVAAVVRICSHAGIAITPQGGNTGYCGGATPDESGEQVVISLSRMNNIRQIDPLNYTVTVEAGCVLAAIQDAAKNVDRLFPLSLGAEGSCQIGGNLSTNAGGVAVLRYGNTRDLVLGLEVVLPDGTVWEGLRRLRKDNTGYDLKQLFLGAEGTLGIITAAALKLFPRAHDIATSFVALPDANAALKLLSRMRSATSDGITSFEYIHRNCIDLVLSHIESVVDPFEVPYEHYALVECSAAHEGPHLRETIEAALGHAFEAGEINDAVIAASGQQAAGLWRLRESIPEAQKLAGAGLKHDISVPLTSVPSFLDRATEAAEDMIPGVKIIPFGHMGDGNIHFNLSRPEGDDGRRMMEKAHDLEIAVHDLAVELDGSFSAEHGIGRLKRGELARYKSEIEFELMQRVKAALDPKGTMNPGKVL